MSTAVLPRSEPRRGIMRRLLREIAEGRALGNATTLATRR
jgi:hypothetical protein